jgi:hypothetical protein
MSERHLKILCFSLFIAFVAVTASPFAEAADNLANWIELIVILGLSVIALHSWFRSHIAP